MSDGGGCDRSRCARRRLLDRRRRRRGRSGRRSRSGRRRRSRLRRRRRRRRRGRGRSLDRRRPARRQEPEGIEIPLVVGGRPDAEVHVGAAHLGRAARTDAADDGALRDDVVASDGDRTEMRQRHGEPVGRLDRQRGAARRNPAGEGHDTGCRSEHRGAGDCRADVDAAMLTPGVRVRVVEREALQHRPGHRPGPRPGRRDAHEEEDQDERCDSGDRRRVPVH